MNIDILKLKIDVLKLDMSEYFFFYKCWIFEIIVIVNFASVKLEVWWNWMLFLHAIIIWYL